MKYVGQMWKRIFDYKGKSSLKEYWVPFAFNAALTVIMVLCLLLKESLFVLFFLTYIAMIIAAYLCLSLVPFISLTVRRLHDAGKSGKWYLLSFVLGVGAIVVIIMCAGKANAFDPYSNFAVCVYGPPDFEDDYDPSENLNADVYGPPEYFETESSEQEIESNYPDNFAPYVPEENVAPTVYGPPEYFETADGENTGSETAESAETDTAETEILYETTIAESAVSEETLYDPEENINEDVYGPPEYFNPPDNSEEIDLPEPELFVPEENAPICVYGPPEFFQ